jgi:hypothetical protein
MGAPAFPVRAMGDILTDLIQAADALDRHRAEADRVAIDLEMRWAANRAARPGCRPGTGEV